LALPILTLPIGTAYSNGEEEEESEEGEELPSGTGDEEQQSLLTLYSPDSTLYTSSIALCASSIHPVTFRVARERRNRKTNASEHNSSS
jgi:hypothetical protein